MFNIVKGMKQKRTKFIGIRTTEEMHKFLEGMSEKHARPVSDVINLLLEYFKKNPPKHLPISAE